MKPVMIAIGLGLWLIYFTSCGKSDGSFINSSEQDYKQRCFDSGGVQVFIDPGGSKFCVYSK